jgi:hypothetical protein
MLNRSELAIYCSAFLVKVVLELVQRELGQLLETIEREKEVHCSADKTKPKSEK